MSSWEIFSICGDYIYICETPRSSVYMYLNTRNVPKWQTYKHIHGGRRIPNQQKFRNFAPRVRVATRLPEMDDSTRVPHPPAANYEAHERQLTMNRARRRQRLTSETPEQREMRLVMERVRTRCCLASETAEQWETRLCQCRAPQSTSFKPKECYARGEHWKVQRTESPDYINFGPVNSSV